ncbi:MAG: 7-cyano-7-deazaguanine synthase QueC [Cyanobacteria bacterium SIG28]|nr:7-cyano-7-deazaguanine synthase QueC [Cyanobacteria bacterium SIG28]
MNKSVILMSGGLDSLVALGFAQKRTDYNVELAITFDYGQKSVEEEIIASKKICEYYNIEHKVIKLDWLKNITKTALVSGENIPEKDFETSKSAQMVWVPNRNALFLNIAAAFCDSFGYNYILYGANKEEGVNFPDNTEEFRMQVSKLFETSTLAKPKVVAPLINYTKSDIVKIAVEESMPLELVRSCYHSGKKHCGKCESCYHLKKALSENNCDYYINILFGENEN